MGDCANILIKENNLPEDTDLIILKLENTKMISNEKSVQYEVYAPGENKKLDLSVCSKTKIDILYSIELDEETKKIYEDLKSQGYDLFDKYNKFYTDICTPYKSEDGTDVILADRTNDFFAKHEIICQVNCDYSSFNSDSSFVKCKCNAVNNERIEAEEPRRVTWKNNLDSFVDILKYSNYRVLYCYKLVFRAVTFYKNLGSIFTMIYFIGYLISFGFFCYYGLTQLKSDIFKLFKKKRNISNLKVNNSNIIINNNINTNRNNKKDVKTNIISNNKLKELIDSENIKNKNDKNNNEQNDNQNKNDIINNFTTKELILPSKSNNININKGNLKRSLKNKKNANIKSIENNNAKGKEVIERDKNITYTDNNKGNIAIKDYKTNINITKNSKGEFPPKKNNLQDKSLKSSINSENKLVNDIVIHKTKLSNKDISSLNKKSESKENLLIKDSPKTDNKLYEEKEIINDETQKNKGKNILSDFELNHLDYNEALKLDNRLFLGIYWSLLKREHPIVYTFMAWNDYNLFFVKLSKFFFLITTIMAFDALFFSNDAMHDIYLLLYMKLFKFY